MAKPEHLARLTDGFVRWNEWRAANLEIQPDLSRANLAGADLSGFNLGAAWLSNANLRKANLTECDLTMAYLAGTDLRKAILQQVNFTGANLRGVNLAGTTLSWTVFTGAYLTDANLRGASFNGAYLRGADLSGADLRKATLGGADLGRAILVGTNLEYADISNCKVYGISAWDVRLKGTSQSNLVITPADDSVIRVDNLEVAQFVYLLLSRRRLRDVITTVGEKAVLILGRFTERKDLLERMADKLRALGYVPMIFDFDRPNDRDLTETVRILAGLSRFVIADITNPRSVPLELQATVPDYMVPFVTMLQRGQPAFGMFDDLPRKYHWALPLLEYKNASTLLAAFESKVIEPALKKGDEVRRAKAALPLRRSAEG